MADTSLIEVARQTHEEAERYQQALVDLLLSSSSSGLTHKDKLKRAHKASDLLDRVASRYQYLDRFYADQHGDRQRELEALSSTRGDDAFGEFYDRLGRIREYHDRYPGALPDNFSIDFTALETGTSSSAAPSDQAATSASATAGYLDASGLDFIDRMFSGEEMAGRFLDLYLHHEAHLNLKGAKRISYLSYIDDFDKLAGPSSLIPNHTKKTDAYRAYLLDLRKYLDSFLRKTQPLANVDEISAKATSEFDEAWEQGQVQGWEEQGTGVFGGAQGKGKAAQASTQGEGEGIWCPACRRFYSKQTVYDAHLKSPKHLKAAARLAQSEANGGETSTPSSSNNNQNEAERIKARVRSKAIAREEAIIRALASDLPTIRADTKSNVERKAALTDRERQAEAEAAENELNRMTALNPTSGLDTDEPSADMDEDDDATSRVYNPLKLPIGWDGRPIPFWLYKLHGLRNEFKCEICSDAVYHGRKNFEKHFTESRHAFGMKALGLPNTVQFRDVTRIADALGLAERLRKQSKVEASEAGVDAQEVEDEHGNTYTKKTYDLLKRQGLI
ncbi:Splicing factor SF3a60 binding domain protein [Kalmanozyma brasiliensis GHG001]|uniref:U1-type domain-containing protein n=1 Tax=Kalmanozyma brasiliensis (strain GHG001) TaxID=1365824 RepID=V5EXV2_KALBG|nr:Splicing factor SF3a60 binding domain protein [Kalmanozyma brasiliensis GHG001]EST07414.1 Splicing factor SF3a60 binding domain protein [Kalmanozyma brasiliensis GHG001]